MNYCVVGWYGTETLGDRAIFDGILRVLTSFDDDIRIFLASLNPFFSERVLFEDYSFYSRNCKHLSVEVFDFYDKKQLHFFVKKADLVLMGGGPIMGILNLYKIQHTFKYSKRHNKKTMIFGCGFGPINSKEFCRVAANIFKHSDLIVMRSKKCAIEAQKLTNKKVFNSLDPAILSVLDFKKACGETSGDLFGFTTPYCLVNVRDIDYVYQTDNVYYCRLLSFFKTLAKSFDGKIVFYPMHTFYAGGDDRVISNKLSQDINSPNIVVLQKPISLFEAYKLCENATVCIGTRYHSIIFQTFLNGNNYIIDYTKSGAGKISSFLNDLETSFYKNRYCNVLEQTFDKCQFVFKDDKFMPDCNIDSQSVCFYRQRIEDLFKNEY